MGDTEPLRLRFGAFELDEQDARLTKGGRPIALPPRAFDVLCALARRPGQLVTKNALLDAVWGHQHVSESVLKTIISELRAALADDARQPRYIETASRRGYRFIAAVSAAGRGTLAAAPGAQWPAQVGTDPETARTPPMIGRGSTLDRLRAAWRQALAGRRQVFWISGEAGVGKTTVIDALQNELGPDVSARGQCVEQFGAGEPYLPVLEALAALCRRDPALVPMMQRIAPTWLLQLPWLSGEPEREALQRELAGSSPDRMLRELGELLDRYTQVRPVLLVTEDLHWSDQATVRLIDHIARRRSTARLMWVGSFRLTEVMAEDHPLKGLRHELRMHRLCDEVVLDPFSEQEVADYVDSRFPGATFSEAFVRKVHAHTDGLPLFVVNVIDDLESQGAIAASQAQAAPDAPTSGWQVPENLAGVMEKQIERLGAELRSLLEAASVCGMEFRPDIVASALQRDERWVAERCEALARAQNWIAHVAIESLPDGSLDARYAFRHALYRHVFYQRIGALTRAQLHRSVATALERGRAAGRTVTPAELASHYDLGHDPMAALRHYGDAADSALGHFAPQEAINLATHALTLLPRCTDGSARAALELALVIKRGVASAQLHGMASEGARSAFERAHTLSDQLPQTPAVGWALSGLGLVRFGEGNYAEAHALGTRIHALGLRHDEPGLQVAACNLVGTSCASLGDHRAARQWLEQGIALCEGLGARLPRERFFIDPGVTVQGHLGVELLALHLVDQARTHAQAALARGRAVGHPMAEALSHRCAGMLELRLEQPERVAAHAAALAQLAGQHGILPADAAARLLGGWAQAHLGDPATGHARILEGLAILQQLGLVAGITQVLCYAAEAAIAGRDWAAARAHVDEALALAQRLGERGRVPDLLLLQGRIALGEGQRDAARSAMHTSLAEARAQEALGFELAALVGLCELDQAQPEELDALRDACARIEEGLDTALVGRAQELLAGGDRAAPPAG